MKYKNFKWKFANSIIIPIGICFSIILIIFSVMFIINNDLKMILITFLILALMLIPSYLISLIIGNHLYVKTKISITDEGIYQNKRLLKYENIKEIYFSKFFKIFYFQMTPIEDNLIISKKILLYFYSLEEVVYFIIIHNFSYVLKYYKQYELIANYINDIINKNGENIHRDYIELFNKQKTYCDCCGNRTIFKRINNDICPVCFWENDIDKSILYNPNIVSEVNHISLIEAKRNYEKYGAIKEEYKDKVRKAFSYENPNFKSRM